MTVKQRYSTPGPLPAHPLETELIDCDGNITAYPAKEQVICSAACKQELWLQVEKLDRTESKRLKSG